MKYFSTKYLPTSVLLAIYINLELVINYSAKHVNLFEENPKIQKNGDNPRRRQRISRDTDELSNAFLSKEFGVRILLSIVGHLPLMLTC